MLQTAASLLCLCLLPSTLGIEWVERAQAHEVKTAEDIGATMHIEPNDTPRAGEEVLAWFALTRRGGQPIPLSECNCQLNVYTQPQTEATLTPTLSAVNAEGYQEIPGAWLTFPAVGAYTLVISGSPKQPEDFAPFELNFDVTVAVGQSVPQVPKNEADKLPKPQAGLQVQPETEAAVETVADGSKLAASKWVTFGAIGAILVGLWVWRAQRSRRKS